MFKLFIAIFGLGLAFASLPDPKVNLVKSGGIEISVEGMETRLYRHALWCQMYIQRTHHVVEC